MMGKLRAIHYYKLLLIAVFFWALFSPVSVEARNLALPQESNNSKYVAIGVISFTILLVYSLSRPSIASFKKLFKRLAVFSFLAVCFVVAASFLDTLSKRELFFQNGLSLARAGNAFHQSSVAEAYAQSGEWPSRYSLFPDYKEAYFWKSLACGSEQSYSAATKCRERLKDFENKLSLREITELSERIKKWAPEPAILGK